MATLPPSGRISEAVVAQEIGRLRRTWRTTIASTPDEISSIIGNERSKAINRLDRVELNKVIRVCRQSRSLNEAGRNLFGLSRPARRSTSDADRLRNHRARFGLNVSAVSR